MKAIWQLHVRGYKLFIKNINRIIGYQLIVSLLLTIFILPLFHMILNLLMKSRGMTYVANGLLQKLLISPQGILLVLTMLIFGFIIVMLQLGGITVIVHQILVESRESRFIDIVLYVMKRLKYMLGFDGIIIAVYFILLAPLLESEIRIGLFDSLTIPVFLVEKIESNTFQYALAILAIGVVVALTVRWMFALHALLLNREQKKHFLRESAKLLKHNLKYIVKYTLVSFAFAVVFAVAGALLMVLGSAAIIALFPFGEAINTLVVFALGIILLYLWGLISIPASLIQLTLLYHQLSGNVDPLEIKVVGRQTRLNRLLSNKAVIGVSAVLLVVGVSAYVYVFDVAFASIKYDVAVTAHRGSSYEAPENTLAAVKQAYENGADFAEVDVQLTKDGHIILLHDASFKRTTGRDARPDQLTLAEVRELDAGSWFSEAFAGEKVATLKEVIDFAKDKIGLNIELKGTGYSPQMYPILVELLREEDFVSSCVITTQSLEDIRQLEALEPKLKTGYIMFLAFGKLDALEVDFYSVEAINVTEAFVENAHRIGREVHVWTVNDEALMEKLIDFGVDNIITDKDKRLREILNEGLSTS